MSEASKLTLISAIVLLLSVSTAAAQNDQSPLRAGNANDRVNVAGQSALATQFLPAEAMPPARLNSKPMALRKRTRDRGKLTIPKEPEGHE